MGRRKKLRERDDKLVVVYVRVSTQGQVDDGASVETQERAARGYCDLRGLTIHKIISDLGESATKPLSERPGGMELKEIVDNSDVSGVVAMRLDRLFRNTLDCLVTTNGWKDIGVSLHVLDLGGSSLDTSTILGSLFLTMAAAFAQLEARLISDRTAAALATKREKGERLGRVPFGQQADSDGLLVSVEAEQAIIRHITALRADGATLQAIADKLNGDGVEPPKARHGGKQGKAWHPATISRIINRPDPAAQDSPS